MRVLQPRELSSLSHWLPPRTGACVFFVTQPIIHAPLQRRSSWMGDARGQRRAQVRAETRRCSCMKWRSRLVPVSPDSARHGQFGKEPGNARPCAAHAERHARGTLRRCVIISWWMVYYDVRGTTCCWLVGKRSSQWRFCLRVPVRAKPAGGHTHSLSVSSRCTRTSGRLCCCSTLQVT